MFHSFLHRRLFFDGACFKQNPRPSNVLGVFGLSVHTTERELDDEFSRFGRVEKVTIVYDQRVSRQYLAVFCRVLIDIFSLTDPVVSDLLSLVASRMQHVAFKS